MNSWESLKQECAVCRACGLCEGRTNLVFGVGNEQADLMFIGEGPGEQEDLQGVPFVGPAGKLLDAMLEMIDLDRSIVYIANIVKCRPGWSGRLSWSTRSSLSVSGASPPPR